MTEKQREATDFILKFVLDNNGRVAEMDLRYAMIDRYGHEDDEVDLLYSSMIREGRLIRRLGQAFVELTEEGEQVAKKGIVKHKRNLNFRERLNLAKDVVALISGICSIISFILGLLTGLSLH